MAGADDPTRAKALLARMEADVAALDGAVAASRVDKLFRRAWHDFVASWRSFYYSEKDHPTSTAPRAVGMYANDLRGWRASFKQAVANHGHSHDVMGAPVIPDVITPGAIRYEWELGRAEIERLHAQIRSSTVRETFLRAWLLYLADWKRAYAESLASNAIAGAAGWKRARAYRKRTATWRGALMREQFAAGGDVGAIFITPGAIKDELETVNSGVKQLDGEIMSSPVRDAFKKSWRLFADEWQRFYASKQGFWGRTWGSTMEKVVEYRKRVDEWRASFLREGGQTATPNLNVPEPPPSGGGFPWLLVGGLLIGGAVLGAKVLR